MTILCIYSPVCSAWFGLVYLLLPGVPVCVSLALSCPALIGFIKDWYFDLHPHLRVPRSSLVCAPWQLRATEHFIDRLVSISVVSCWVAMNSNWSSILLLIAVNSTSNMSLAVIVIVPCIILETFNTVYQWKTYFCQCNGAFRASTNLC